MLALVSTKTWGSKAERSLVTLLSAMSGSNPAMVMSKLRARAMLTASRMDSAMRGPLMLGGATLLRGRSKEVSADMPDVAAEAASARGSEAKEMRIESAIHRKDINLGGLI